VLRPPVKDHVIRGLQMWQGKAMPACVHVRGLQVRVLSSSSRQAGTSQQCQLASGAHLLSSYRTHLPHHHRTNVVVHRVLHNHCILLRHRHLQRAGEARQWVESVLRHGPGRQVQVQGQSRARGWQATNWQATKEGCSGAPRRLPHGSRWALWGAGRAPRRSCGGGLTARGSGGRQSPPAASAAGRGRG
jgi:hypothetical protein